MADANMDGTEANLSGPQIVDISFKVSDSSFKRERPEEDVDAAKNSKSTADSVVKKRRRKAIKSCAFCRKRKLRCDQQRPRCSTCVARGLTECVYLTGLESKAEDEIRTGSDYTLQAESDNEEEKSNVNLIEKLDELQKQLQSENHVDNEDPLVQLSNKRQLLLKAQQCNGDHAIPARLTKETTYIPLRPTGASRKQKNILREYFVLQCKGTGRRILYGPTSTRIFLAKGNWGLAPLFRQVYGKFKAKRVQWKKSNNFTMLQELSTVEMPLSSKDKSSGALTKEVCSVLPTYEKIESSIELFFSNDVVFEMSTILDKAKVKRDFERSFLAGASSAKHNGERPIIDLIPSDKKNYYKLGVIVTILILTHYHTDVPVAIEKFLIYLTGLSTAKVSYVERAQFLLLRYHYRVENVFTGGDDSHVMLLVDQMTSCALYLGLNHNIKVLYGGQEEEVGNLETLERMWLWILFADCNVSTQIGRSLRISDDDISDDAFFEDSSPDFYGLMKRFIKVVRLMLFDVHNKRQLPALESHCESLIDFIEQEFPPLSLFHDLKLVSQVDMHKLRILCQALSLLIAFYSLRYLAFKELSIRLKNGVIKATLIAFSVHVNITLHCYELDKKHFPEMLQPGYKFLSPYLCHSISVVHGLTFRAMAVFYSLAYNSLTLFEGGLLSSLRKHTTLCDLSSLRTQDDMFISFLAFFKIFLQTYDKLVGPENNQFLSIAKKSHGFVCEIAFERICRTVIEKVMECRSNVENNWMNDKRSRTDNSVLSSPMKSAASSQIETPKNHLSLGLDGNLPNSMYYGSDFSLPNTNNDAVELPAPLSNSEDTEIAQISEDFWLNYNVGWQEILQSAEYEEFFHEIML